MSQGKVAWGSAEDYDRVSQYTWHAREDPSGNWYAIRQVRLDSGGKQRQRPQSMHQFITGYTPMTDHRDGNGLNNRHSNLRPATNAQNQYNSPPKRGGSSKYKGVFRKQHRRKCWAVCIVAQGVAHFVGLFEDELDAARAADLVMDELHGEFAWLNCDHFDELEDWWHWQRHH